MSATTADSNLESPVAADRTGDTPPSGGSAATAPEETVAAPSGETAAITRTAADEASRKPNGRIRDPERRERILQAATELIARHGYRNVSLDDIGAAAGIVGSGVYRHFNTKVDILAQILDDVVDRLVSDSEAILRATDQPEVALAALVRGQIDFTLMERALCVVYVGELKNLPRADRHRLRWKQRHYVDLWIDLLLMAHPDVTPEQAQLRVHAAISAIHSVLLYHSPLDADELTVQLGSVAGEILLLPPDLHC